MGQQTGPTGPHRILVGQFDALQAEGTDLRDLVLRLGEHMLHHMALHDCAKCRKAASDLATDPRYRAVKEATLSAPRPP